MGKEAPRCRTCILQTNQPIAAVGCWPKNGFGGAKGVEGPCDVPACDAGYIRTNDTNRSRRLPRQGAGHSFSEIALPLLHTEQMRGPNPAGHALTVRGNSQDEPPARILYLPEQPFCLVTKPPGRAGHADLPTQARLYAARARFLEHDNKRSFHAK